MELEYEARQVKHSVESNSKIVKDIADQLVKKYCRDLDNAIDEIKELLKDKDNIEVSKLNYYISYLPILMYYSGNGLEDLGINSDLAKTTRQDAFNEAYLKAGEGTIPEKTSIAQRAVISESVVEKAFDRAYKKVKSRLEYASTLHGSLKKVLQWKISELEVTRTNI